MKTLAFQNTHVEKILPEAAAVLKNGGLIIAPSDTVYGLLVDATNEKAVQKLIQFKNRPIGKPISVFVADFEMLHDYVVADEKQDLTIKHLLPGPFTVVLQSKHKTSKLLESEKGTLGVRIPDYSLIQNLLLKYGKPVTATSANVAGRPPHYSVETLLRELPDSKKELVDLIIDAGKLPRNKPSTVIDVSQPEIKIMRKGDVVWNKEKTYVSESPEQTKKIAQFVFKKFSNMKKNKAVIFIIQGELGVGKTIFVKGLAELFNIDNIISPTFVIYYEYPVINHDRFKNLYHFDLYNIEEKEEFDHLGIEKLLKKEHILCFEWGEKTGEIFNSLTQNSDIMYVTMKYTDEKKREITIQY